MYPSGSRYGVDAVSLPLPLPIPFPFPLHLPPGNSLLEFHSFTSTELVPATDDVAPVRVAAGREVVQERKHFGCVAAAAEDDEEVCWSSAFSG